jgi:predicted Rossmann-fold nucleotide-binding protein
MSVPDVKRRVDGVARRRRPVVTVIGSGLVADPGCGDVGRLVASLGFDLLTGGGRGVMEAVSRAFFEMTPRRGLVIGVVPATVEPLEALEDREAALVEYLLPPGYPNEWVEIVIYTHLPDSGMDGTQRSSRNHINVLSADAIVAFPGREGTETEMWLATQYRVPIIAFGEHQIVPHGITRAASIADVERFLRASPHFRHPPA